MALSSAPGKPSPRTFPLVVWPLLASALAWGVLFAVVPPTQQDFPLNDDWAFARGAFQFAGGEGLHYAHWASMPQLGQWLWACPFLWLLGFTHVALRLATITLSWLGLWAFSDLLRQQDFSPARAALATAALAFNPLFFLLQGTFMTDVPALSLALAALALYGRALARGGVGWLVGGCVVAALAVATRQNTLAVPVVAAVLLWRQPALRGRFGWWLGVLLPVVLGVVVHLWFQGREDVRPLKPTVAAPPALLLLPFLLLHLCGLSVLPLLLLGPQVRSLRRWGGILVLLLACAGYWLLYGTYLPYGGLFPYAENMLSPVGAFAGSKFTGLLVVGERPVLLGNVGRVVLSVLGCVAGAALVVRASEEWRPGAWTSPLLLFTLLQIPFLLVTPDLYDRYILFLIPGALALLGASRPAPAHQDAARWHWWAALATVTVLGLLSLGLMHDWLAWNAARWHLGRRALAHHIDAHDIEGGVEWDGWFAGVGGQPPSSRPPWPVLPFTREWFPQIRGRYALSFSELRGSRRLDAEPYTLWLTPGARQFFLLEVPPLPEKEPTSASPAPGVERTPTDASRSRQPSPDERQPGSGE